MRYRIRKLTDDGGVIGAFVEMSGTTEVLSLDTGHTETPHQRQPDAALPPIEDVMLVHFDADTRTRHPHARIGTVEWTPDIAPADDVLPPVLDSPLGEWARTRRALKLWLRTLMRVDETRAQDRLAAAVQSGGKPTHSK